MNGMNGLNGMNGFATHGMDEDAFGAKKGGLGDGLRTFDAFPKTKITYTTHSSRGGQWTLVLLAVSVFLTCSELLAWYTGHETHQFSVEKEVGHTMQINIDAVLPMRCEDVHVNAEDASGDLTLAAYLLKRESTSWSHWDPRAGGGGKAVHVLGGPKERGYEEEEHVADVIGAARHGRRKFSKTPKIRKGEAVDACRIFGSLEVNKVQGDFHITARGHGYAEMGQHLDHEAFNFSHIINELSFGPFYPSLHNPLDQTIATTPAHFYRYQYYLSLVPTLYTSSSSSPSILALLNPLTLFFPSSSGPAIRTNQYAITTQSYLVGERDIPGIFFKYDIEPILLLVAEDRPGLLWLLVRVVNAVSGVLVAGGWCYSLGDWVAEVWGRRRARGGGSAGGMLGGMEKGG
ncbi:MAG: hypothetical protein M1817_006014 [Caeruleum heppii]|nr:MAG: hypothetical protein M1817_006014 [Caeruleum heppii]